MSLKIARIIALALGLALLLAAFFLPYNRLKVYVILGLFTAMTVVSYRFLRCPCCGAQLKLWGMKVCPGCGEKIDWNS